MADWAHAPLSKALDIGVLVAHALWRNSGPSVPPSTCASLSASAAACRAGAGDGAAADYGRAKTKFSIQPATLYRPPLSVRSGRGRRSEAPKNGGECHHTPAALISAPTVEHVKGANNCPSRKTALAGRCSCRLASPSVQPAFQIHVDAPARAQLRLEVLVAPLNRPPNLSDASPQ